jgi:hypothetical protein
MQVMNHEVEIVTQAVDDMNVEYTLYADMDGNGGSTVAKDLDADAVIEIRHYPVLAEAKAGHDYNVQFTNATTT